MTNKEAKRVLEKLCYNSFWFEGLSLDEKLAIKMAITALSEDKGETYGEVINFYLNSLVETYKRMGYTITEISITEKNSLTPTVYGFEERGE